MEIEERYKFQSKINTLEREKQQLQERLDMQLEITKNACMALCQSEYKAHQRFGWCLVNLAIGFGLGALWIYVGHTVFDWIRGLL
jgi:hypothetical protein